MDGSDGVYPASEDTFLLLDALKQDEEFLKERIGDHALCLEIGCGSGAVSAFIASMLTHSQCLCSDVNRLATHKTKQTLAEQEIRNADVVLCDLFTAFKPSLVFDLVVFNPPYVPTDQEELQRALKTHDISASWAGGRDGREVIDKFLVDFLSFLSVRGVVYLVVLDANNPTQLQVSARRLGLQVTMVMERKAGMEQLYILRFQKN